MHAIAYKGGGRGVLFFAVFARTCYLNDPNVDPDSYSYSGYGISFDTHGKFHCQKVVDLIKIS